VIGGRGTSQGLIALEVHGLLRHSL
jgi:hypothetical protein